MRETMPRPQLIYQHAGIPLGIRLAHSDKLYSRGLVQEGPGGGAGGCIPLEVAPLEELRWRLAKVAYLLLNGLHANSVSGNCNAASKKLQHACPTCMQHV